MMIGLFKIAIDIAVFPLRLIGVARRAQKRGGPDNPRQQRLNKRQRRHIDLMVTIQEEGISRQARLLDVGCGTGAVIRRLHQAGFERLEGCDWLPEPEMLARMPAGSVYRQVDLNRDGLAAWGDDSLDAVVCSDVLEHLENPALMLREFARVLRPGGVALLTLPNAFNLSERVFTLLTGDVNRYRTEDTTTSFGHISMLPLSVLRSLSRRAGLTVKPVGRGYVFIYHYMMMPWRTFGPRWSYVVNYRLDKPATPSATAAIAAPLASGQQAA